ncbi:hypothetical protein [Terrabacter sp. Soil810]|uniref:hypothetical protein n=1 Tax=Terrabacter sp. Soil810 TaxID=1736418 RepID=UPI00070DF9C4|nr:hypothetical protein [Terrabacter sp. Soil810]KRF40609.1 hypothetical protein ASG96_07050 [Terrabacter sp. Soil810]
MDPRLPGPLHELALHQLGVLTRRQLLEGGLTQAQLRTRLGREWRLVLRVVVLLSNGVPSEQQRLMAALLFAGPRSWLAGSSAAAVHGIAGRAVSNPILVLVPTPLRSRAHAWVLVRNTTLLDEPIYRRGPLRLSCPARAAVDAAAAAPSDEQARAVLVAAAQSRKARLSDLARRRDAALDPLATTLGPGADRDGLSRGAGVRGARECRGDPTRPLAGSSTRHATVVLGRP